MIVGAHAIDHQSRGGVGHQPAANGHWMQTLNMMMDRIDQCAGRVHRKDGIYSCEEASSAVFGMQLVTGSCVIRTTRTLGAALQVFVWVVPTVCLTARLASPQAPWFTMVLLLQ